MLIVTLSYARNIITMITSIDDRIWQHNLLPGEEYSLGICQLLARVESFRLLCDLNVHNRGHNEHYPESVESNPQPPPPILYHSLTKFPKSCLPFRCSKKFVGFAVLTVMVINNYLLPDRTVCNLFLIEIVLSTRLTQHILLDFFNVNRHSILNWEFT
jgi:hypothetical protein